MQILRIYYQNSFSYLQDACSTLPHKNYLSQYLDVDNSSESQSRVDVVSHNSQSCLDEEDIADMPFTSNVEQSIHNSENESVLKHRALTILTKNLNHIMVLNCMQVVSYSVLLIFRKSL